MQSHATHHFTTDLLDSLTAQVAILNSEGVIIAVNDAWRRFAAQNDARDGDYYVGTNYLTICKRALRNDPDPSVAEACGGLTDVLEGKSSSFFLEYPCHSPTEEFWFVGRFTRFEHQGEQYIVATHEDITAGKKMENILAESNDRFHNLTRSLPDAIYTLDLVTRDVGYFNLDSFLGYSRDELMAPGSIFSQIHPDDAPSVQVYWQRIMEGKEVANLEYRLRNQAGNWEWVDSRNFAISQLPDGGPREMVLILRVITDRKLAEEQIAQQAKLLENVNDVIIGTNEEFHITYWNRAAERIFGWKAEDVQGRSVTDVLRTEFITVTYEDSVRILTETDMWRGEVMQYTRDDRPVVIDANIMAIRDGAGRRVGFVSANRDITEQKQARENLEEAYRALEVKKLELERALRKEQYLARTDGLTGVNNHRHFIDLAAREFAVSERYRHSLSILLCDIDRFKRVNDTYGHSVGDATLRHVAQAISRRLRASDVLGRYGGEEFVVLLPNTTLEDSQLVAEELRESIARSSLKKNDQVVEVTISIGVAQIGPEGDSLNKLLQRADAALYQAKQAGRNCVRVYSGGSS